MTKALTLKSNDGIQRVLSSDIQVLIPGQITPKVQIKAIWDTGATGTVITKKVADHLKLQPTGMVMVSTANGQVPQQTFTIDVGLPSGVLIKGIVATAVDSLTGGIEALIGMDIITLGDFSITNHKGVTCMSFRIPSGHEIDYVVNTTYGVTPITKTPFKSTNYTPPRKKRK